MTDEAQSGEESERAPIWLNLTSDAPTVLVDGLAHVSVNNGVVRMAFVQYVAEPLNGPFGEQGFRSKYVVNLAMPVTQVENTLAYLQKTIANFRADGILPPEES